jgi:hypothetical protein
VRLPIPITSARSLDIEIGPIIIVRELKLFAETGVIP